MRGSSLATRLFLSATAWVVVILVITGVILSSVYRNATERAFDRRLNLYLRTLIAEVATPDEPPDHQFQSLGEPLFELPLSGWYWQIVRTDEKAETRASRSLWDKKLPKLEDIGAELTPAGIRLGYVDGPEGQSLRIVAQCVKHMPAGPYKSSDTLATPPLKERTMHDIETLIHHFVHVSWGPVMPPGESFFNIEGTKGAYGYYLISDGGTIPYRLRIRTASFPHLQMIPKIARGLYVADLIALLGSIDFVMADVDR